MLAETRLVQDMAEFTGRIAERVGLLARVEEKLEQADLPIRPTEAIFFYGVAVFLVLFAAMLLFGIAPGLVLAFFAAIGAVVFLEMRGQRRLRKLGTQLADVPALLAG